MTRLNLVNRCFDHPAELLEHHGEEIRQDNEAVATAGLDGTIRPVPGVLPLVDALPEGDVVVAPASAAEAAVLGRHRVRLASSLRQLLDALRRHGSWADPPASPPPRLRRTGPQSL